MCLQLLVTEIFRCLDPTSRPERPLNHLHLELYKPLPQRPLNPTPPKKKSRHLRPWAVRFPA